MRVKMPGGINQEDVNSLVKFEKGTLINSNNGSKKYYVQTGRSSSGKPPITVDLDEILNFKAYDSTKFNNSSSEDQEEYLTECYKSLVSAPEFYNNANPGTQAAILFVNYQTCQSPRERLKLLQDIISLISKAEYEGILLNYLKELLLKYMRQSISGSLISERAAAMLELKDKVTLTNYELKGLLTVIFLVKEYLTLEDFKGVLEAIDNFKLNEKGSKPWIILLIMCQSLMLRERVRDKDFTLIDDYKVIKYFNNYVIKIKEYKASGDKLEMLAQHEMYAVEYFNDKINDCSSPKMRGKLLSLARDHLHFFAPLYKSEVFDLVFEKMSNSFLKKVSDKIDYEKLVYNKELTRLDKELKYPHHLEGSLRAIGEALDKARCNYNVSIGSIKLALEEERASLN
jgi:hypothetical protein